MQINLYTIFKQSNTQLLFLFDPSEIPINVYKADLRFRNGFNTADNQLGIGFKIL